jgi:hypothetical protein
MSADAVALHQKWKDKVARAAAEPTVPPVVGEANAADGTQMAKSGAVAASAHSKYRNRPTGGYASRKEARRAEELKLLEQAGAIRDLREQVPFILIPAQKDASGRVIERMCKYVADFVYAEAVSGQWAIEWRRVVEDVKSDPSKTEAYRIKKKLMLMVHGVRILET